MPDALDQIVLGNDALAVLHQIKQKIEHLRLDCDILAAAREFAHAGIEHMVREVELHATIPVAC